MYKDFFIKLEELKRLLDYSFTTVRGHCYYRIHISHSRIQTYENIGVIGQLFLPFTSINPSIEQHFTSILYVY